MTYSIKNFKTFKGHDGESCAQGTLHGPSGRVADWSDDSWGGSLSFRFTNIAAEAEFAVFAKTYLADKLDVQGKVFDVASLNNFALVERAIECMRLAHQREKDALKAVKKAIVYYRKDPQAFDGKSLYVQRVAYTPENVAKLRVEDTDLIEIVNERLGLPFVGAKQLELSEQERGYRKACRTVTLFSIRDSNGHTTVMQSDLRYCSAEASRLRGKYPNLVEIINERFL